MRTLCKSCLRSVKVCLCDRLTPFATHNEFLILMHPKEAKRQKVGTGRYAHLLLKSSNLEVGVCFDNSPQLLKLINDPETWVGILYPGEKSSQIDQNWVESTASYKKKVFVLIDATWPLALKIMRESRILHDLPWISFTNDQSSRFSIKQQPHPLCLSTIESISVVIETLVQIGQEAESTPYLRLNQALELLVEQQKSFEQRTDLQRYRPGQFKKSNQRKEIQTLRNEKRKRPLFFRGTLP